VKSSYGNQKKHITIIKIIVIKKNPPGATGGPNKKQPRVLPQNQKECLMHKYVKNGEKNKSQAGFEQQLGISETTSSLIQLNMNRSKHCIINQQRSPLNPLSQTLGLLEEVKATFIHQLLLLLSIIYLSEKPIG